MELLKTICWETYWMQLDECVSERATTGARSGHTWSLKTWETRCVEVGLLPIVILSEQYIKAIGLIKHKSPEIIEKDIQYNITNDLENYLAINTLRSRFGRNTVISPLAAKLSLCVLAKHAIGASKAELMASLGLRNETVANHCYLDVRTSLRSVMEADLILFNNIFVHTKYRLKLPFANTSVPFSGVQVTKVGFEYPKQAMDYINRWGESVTYKRVQDILNPSDVSTGSQLVVVNAAYFKTSWEFPFNLLYSKMEKFYVTEKSSLLVPMMNLVGEFQFNENAPNYQLLNLYLACWGGSLTIVLPTARYGLATLLEEITKHPSMIKEAKEKTKYKMMKITLPRIKIKANIDLLDELDKIGIRTVLNNLSSGLDEIINKNPPESKDVPALSNIKQKVVLDVDETGSFRHRYAEDEIVRSNQERIYIDDPKNFKFVVNHPFLFIVNVMGSGADFGTRRTSISGKPVAELKELFVGAYYGPQKFD